MMTDADKWQTLVLVVRWFYTGLAALVFLFWCYCIVGRQLPAMRLWDVIKLALITTAVASIPAILMWWRA